jgi:hypothetical protein
MTIDDVEKRRLEMMEELKQFITVHNKHNFFGTARRFQRALIELQNCAPLLGFERNKRR